MLSRTCLLLSRLNGSPSAGDAPAGVVIEQLKNAFLRYAFPELGRDRSVSCS
jgi:hypothetical protein